MIKDREILEAAIIGYETQIGQIEARIADIRRQLGGSAASRAKSDDAVPSPLKKKTRRKMSAEARQAIAAAQKKRWAEWKKQHGKS